MKDVATLRKGCGRREQPMSASSPNGATPSAAADDLLSRREPGELKHLMYPEEEKAVP
jgi:hypothetical protein